MADDDAKSEQPKLQRYLVSNFFKTIKNLYEKVVAPRQLGVKQEDEAEFWQSEIRLYVKWYEHKVTYLYKTPAPLEEEKVKATNIRDSSILTWHKLHQEVKYLEDLALTDDAFRGMRLLDVGAGPIASATCFKGANLYCLEPLLPRYLDAGYPIHYYNAKFICAASEAIPVADGFFDAVISVNAIDHVDNIGDTAAEIRRVLKPGGLFRMHVHYHPATTTEPLTFSDESFLSLFGWCSGIEKVYTKSNSHSADLSSQESFVLWSNFK